jgi:hypothetical protein
MEITDGRTNLSAEVNALNQLMTRAVSENRAAYVSDTKGEAWTVHADDADVAADEYLIWLKNTGTTPIVINSIFTSNQDADAIWKLHSVTGTGGTAAAITPVNLNLSSGNDAEVSCNGGAGGVSGLTSSSVITGWAGGVAYFNQTINLWLDALIIGTNDAIALEFDVGTGTRAMTTIMFHNKY